MTPPPSTLFRHCIAVLLAWAAAPCEAARPLVTDDARLLDARACQLESWIMRNRDTTEAWALPACNPWGEAEFALGGAVTREHGSTRTTDVQAQVKTVFKALDDDGWGVGLVFGTVHRPTRESERGLGDTYSYVPMSFAVPRSPVAIHVNLGAARRQDEQRTVFIWAVASETTLSERFTFLLETFGQGRERPLFQLGVRYEVVKDRMQVDASCGNRISGGAEDRWFSIGVRFQTPPFLP